MKPAEEPQAAQAGKRMATRSRKRTRAQFELTHSDKAGITEKSEEKDKAGPGKPKKRIRANLPAATNIAPAVAIGDKGESH